MKKYLLGMAKSKYSDNMSWQLQSKFPNKKVCWFKIKCKH